MTSSCFPHRALPASAFALLVLGLGGCSWLTPSDPSQGVACPEASAVPLLARVARFSAGGSDPAYQGQIGTTKTSCSFSDGAVDIDASLQILVQRADKTRAADADFPYFVAVVDGSGTVLAKSVFSAPQSFKPGQPRAGSVEEVTERIPFTDPHRVAGDHIVVGFQLQPAELDYNRRTGLGR